MDVVPQEVRFAAANLAAFSRNRLKLETAGATSASAGNIVTVTLPENAVIDLKSFKVHMRLTTTSENAGATQVFTKLPADVSSLIRAPAHRAALADGAGAPHSRACNARTSPPAAL